MMPSVGQPSPVGKPSPVDLGIDLTQATWERSGDGDGSIEVAFPLSERWARGDWVLMRVAGDPADRVLVFDRSEEHTSELQSPA